MIAALRASLARLQLAHVDLYQLHGFDPATPIEETLRALDDLVRAGDVRYVGVSNWAAWQIAKALGLSALQGLARFASVQAYYSLAARDVEREIVPMAVSEGLGLLVWSPLAGGLMSGRHGREANADGSRRASMAFPPVETERAFAVLDVLRPIAAREGVSVARLAIAWLLRRPGVASVLIGARRIEQLEDNLGAIAVEFTAEDLAAIDEASRLPAEYPGWMLGMWSGARAEQRRASLV